MIYRIFTVLCLLGFYGIYIRKLLDQRGKGIVTDQLGKGKKPQNIVKVELLTKAATYLVLVVEIIDIFSCDPKVFGELRFAGACCCLVGIAFMYASVKCLGDNWRAGIPAEDETRLVTGGIYRLSRNPAFLGFDLMYLGVLLMFFNLLLLLTSVFAMVMLHLQILNEERFLEEKFGEEYLRYKERTGRYFSS